MACVLTDRCKYIHCTDCPEYISGDIKTLSLPMDKDNIKHLALQLIEYDDTLLEPYSLASYIIVDAGYQKQITGRWISSNDNIGNLWMYKCSNCLSSQATVSPYCPICGARMCER